MISLDGQKPSLRLMRIQRKLAEYKLALDDNVIKKQVNASHANFSETALSAHLELPVEQFA